MKKQFLLPILSTALLAPAFLAGQVYAEEATTPQKVQLSQQLQLRRRLQLLLRALRYRKFRQLQKRLHLQKLRQLLLNLLKAKKRTLLSYTPMMSMVVL